MTQFIVQVLIQNAVLFEENWDSAGKNNDRNWLTKLRL